MTPASFLFHGFMEDLISARLTHTHKDTGTAQEILEDISFEAVVLFTYGRSGQVREEEGMKSALETKIRQKEWECLKGRCETCWQRERERETNAKDLWILQVASTQVYSRPEQNDILAETDLY